jgi:hypothetical protein
MYDILWERRAFESLNDIHSFIVSINFQGCANKHFMLWIKPVWTKINVFLDVEEKNTSICRLDNDSDNFEGIKWCVLSSR